MKTRYWLGKKRWSKINPHPMLGRNHTEQTKKKISISKTKYGKVYMKCKNCHEVFYYKPYKKKYKRVFCSDKCKHELGATTGYKRTEESKKKMSIKYAGANNPNWRGGISFGRKRRDEKRKQREWRKAVFENDAYTCIWCGDNKGGNLNADHIKPYALCGEEEKWDNKNGQTLCEDCHRKKTNWELRFYWRNQHGQSENILTK